MYSFPNLEPVHCSMSSFNCCFLTGKQISQEAGKVVWYSHLLKNLPQFFHKNFPQFSTVKGFTAVNKAVQFSSVKLLSRVRLFVSPWITARQASLSITNSWSLLKLMFVESMMRSNHLSSPSPPTLVSTYKWYHTVLSFSVNLFHFSIMPS